MCGAPGNIINVGGVLDVSRLVCVAPVSAPSLLAAQHAAASAAFLAAFQSAAAPPCRVLRACGATGGAIVHAPGVALLGRVALARINRVEMAPATAAGSVASQSTFGCQVVLILAPVF